MTAGPTQANPEQPEEKKRRDYPHMAVVFLKGEDGTKEDMEEQMFMKFMTKLYVLVRQHITENAPPPAYAAGAAPGARARGMCAARMQSPLSGWRRD